VTRRTNDECDTLEVLKGIATSVGAVEVVEEIDELLRRAADRLVYVACVGEFKRGKSTLINALVGADVLPTGIVPVTSVPTVVRYGEHGARVREEGGWRDIDPTELVAYVSQEGNPGNAKQCRGVEVTLPHPLLRDGLCLVDTPGLGSVFEENTASAEDFIPHIDAAILVLGAYPPISGEELRFATRLTEQVDTLLFVLTKADQVPADHRQQASAFAERVLHEGLKQSDVRIFETSAVTGPRGDVGAADWSNLVETLETLSRESGMRMLHAALARGVRRLGGQLDVLLREERAALVRPIEESERRLKELADLGGWAQRARYELAPLLAAEAQRLGGAFEQRRLDFLRCVPAAREKLRARVARHAGDHRRLRRADVVEIANVVAREELDPWLTGSEGEAERAYREAMERFVTLAEGFLERLGDTTHVDQAALDFDGSVEAGFTRRGFYFASLMSRAYPSGPWTELIEALLPRRARNLRLTEEGERYLVDLLEVNAQRVESDLRDRVRESERQLKGALDRLLTQVGRAAARAVERGREARAQGEERTRAELERVDGLLADLARLGDAEPALPA
jgi:GTP-binding protein EngB required for normal cell division